MKLKLSLQAEPKHSDLVSCLGWANANELYSVGDDHLILKWDFQSGETKQVVSLPPDTYATDIRWCPSSGTSRRPTSQPDLFVLACTDGKFLLVSRLGRVEKTVDAHKGAVLGASWSGDFTALMTYGEDGSTKVWSRTGMLRTILVQSGGPIYSACWSPDADQVLYANGKGLVIKPLQSGLKPMQWTAHDGIILCTDWSSANNLIVSGGEDRKYKVWDSYGRNVYSSYLHDSPICSVAWAPDGELFAVGAFNTLRLCDKKGWSCSLEKPTTGSIIKMTWTSDGTQFAGACGNGQVVFAQVVDRHLEWSNLEATVNGDGSIDINNVTNSAREHLDFHDRIIKVSLGCGHLIVTTSTQCYIYNARNWTTPVTVDLRSGAIAIIKQADRHFLLADDLSGILIISYEGRMVSTIKAGGLCSLNPQTMAISVDTVVLRERKDEKNVHVYDAFTGKEIDDGGQALHHQNDIISLGLSQSGPTHERLLAILDKNSDLFLTSIHGPTRFKVFSLGSMVTSICWNDSVNMLAAMQGDKFIVWYHPAVIYSDKDLLPLTQFTKEGSEFSKSPQLSQFTGRHCSLRRSDGALLATSLSPFPTLLHQHAAAGKWEAAVRLCRFVKDPALWACLSGMAAGARDLNTAEVAYAAINEVDKVQFISYLRELPTAERRNAELALFFRQPHQAEAIYLQAGLIFRAIQLNMSLFNWERALELAVKHKTHVDTVLAFRERYLDKIGSKENIKRYLHYSGKLSIDWAKINAKVALEEGQVQN